MNFDEISLEKDLKESNESLKIYNFEHNIPFIFSILYDWFYLLINEGFKQRVSSYGYALRFYIKEIENHLIMIEVTYNHIMVSAYSKSKYGSLDALRPILFLNYNLSHKELNSKKKNGKVGITSDDLFSFLDKSKEMNFSNVIPQKGSFFKANEEICYKILVEIFQYLKDYKIHINSQTNKEYFAGNYSDIIKIVENYQLG